MLFIYVSFTMFNLLHLAVSNLIPYRRYNQR